MGVVQLGDHIEVGQLQGGQAVMAAAKAVHTASWLGGATSYSPKVFVHILPVHVITECVSMHAKDGTQLSLHALKQTISLPRGQLLVGCAVTDVCMAL